MSNKIPPASYWPEGGMREEHTHTHTYLQHVPLLVEALHLVPYNWGTLLQGEDGAYKGFWFPLPDDHGTNLDHWVLVRLREHT